MLPSLQIAKLFGIPIKLHWSFYLLLGYFVFTAGLGADEEHTPQQLMLLTLLYAVLIFGSVVLHELGHALMARRYGIPTLEILLTPIGGIAKLRALPEKGGAEILVAVAGPAVNVVIVALTAAAWLPDVLAGDWQIVADRFGALEFDWRVLLTTVGLVNAVMCVFNLLPAFPMDGARILRGALNTKKRGRLKATEIAVIVSRVIAVLMGIAALQFDVWLLLIAAFVWITGAQELRMVRYQEAMRRGQLDAMPGMAQFLRMLARASQAQQARHPEYAKNPYFPYAPPPGGVPPRPGAAPPPESPPPQTAEPGKCEATWVHPVEDQGAVTDARFEYEGQQIIPPQRPDDDE